MIRSVILVTGGGRGIGRAICERFASNESLVVAIARSAEELAETKHRVEAKGGRCEVHPVDLALPDELEAFIHQTVERFTRIDVLVNNAGVAPRCEIEALELSVFEAMLLVNVTAVYRACRAVWPVMKRQGGGAIVNISSIASLDPFPGFAAYGAAKAWVNAWTRGLAEEGRASNIRVFSVAPGAVDTKLLRDLFPDFPGNQTLPPLEIADLVFTLSQPNWRHATGQTVFVRK